MFRLDSKVAVVTGASSGIGRETAQALAGAGARVLAVGRDSDRTDETGHLIQEAGGESETLICDVCEQGAPETVVERALDRFGGLDILVPAAGLFDPQPLEQTTLESFDQQFEVNVRAPYALVKAAIEPLMQAQGTVIFFSSIAGHVGFPNASSYCATKGAIELMTKALALEFAGRGVRFNAVAPGNVATPMNAHLFEDPEYEAAMLAATPAGRVGEVQDIAPTVVYLASDAARYVHGVSILVDGGWVAG